MLVGQITLLPERSGGEDDLAGDLAAAEFAVGGVGVGDGMARWRYATEITAGTGHDRFGFTISLMIDGLSHRWQ